MDRMEADRPVNYFRLPGGIDVFVRGYVHDRQWQKNHGEFLKKANKHAKIICIEGFVDQPFGKSLDLYWSDQKTQLGHYDVLMKEAVDAGFKGLFTEIDARDTSKICMDNLPNGSSPELPTDFYNKYFEFLQRENPTLTKIISSPEKLKQALIVQSTTKEGLYEREKEIYRHGTYYHSHPYLSKEGKVSLEPTFLGLGQKLFNDALSAIKLYLIAKLMTDGYIEEGPIIDYAGAAHLSSKSFFLRVPKYAVEVVLRNVNELMAGKVKEKGNISEIYKVFENPDWSEIVKEINRLVFKEVEDEPSKPTAVGHNQRKLIDKPINFLKIYNIDPRRVIPSDEQIEKIRKKLRQVK